MTQELSQTSGDGPKTPISPMGKSGTLKAGDKEKKIGHRRIGEGGEVTYKKVPNVEIVFSCVLLPACVTYVLMIFLKHHSYFLHVRFFNRFKHRKSWDLYSWESVMRWEVWHRNPSEIYSCKISWRWRPSSSRLKGRRSLPLTIIPSSAIKPMLL